jgi:hypothetical protein
LSNFYSTELRATIFAAYRWRINMARIARLVVPGLPHHVA